MAGPALPSTDPLFPAAPNPQVGGNFAAYGGVTVRYTVALINQQRTRQFLSYSLQSRAGNPEQYIDIVGVNCDGQTISDQVRVFNPNNGFLQDYRNTIQILGSNACSQGQPLPTGNEVAPARERPRRTPYNPLAVPREQTPEVVPPPTAPTPDPTAPPAPTTWPKAPPQDAPEAPAPGPSLPAGDPLQAPVPIQNPRANPDPTAAPQASPSNTPSRASDAAIAAGVAAAVGAALGIPSLLKQPTEITGKIGDPTTPGQFTQPPPVPPQQGIPTPPNTGCRCNAPLLAAQAAQAAEMTDMQADLEAIKRAIGVDGLPASVPDQIAKENPGQMMIGSLAELHLWQVQQLDGVLGKWPVGIPIPTPTGTTTVGMPNMAEAVAEMVGMLVSQQVTATQILNTSSRALVQAGSATQQAHLAHLVAKANAEFLGYENRPTQVDMPLAFDPGKDPFDGLLNESTQKIRGFENTDGQDLKAILAEVLQAAAIIRAVYWRKLDPRGDLRKQLKDQLRGQSDFIDQAAAGNGDDSDWEAYLRAVEEGFRGATGEANPYNRRPDEGPQIRDRSPGNDNQR